jgi:hypothetical protein
MIFYRALPALALLSELDIWIYSFKLPFATSLSLYSTNR